MQLKMPSYFSPPIWCHHSICPDQKKCPKNVAVLPTATFRLTRYGYVLSTRDGFPRRGPKSKCICKEVELSSSTMIEAVYTINRRYSFTSKDKLKYIYDTAAKIQW